MENLQDHKIELTHSGQQYSFTVRERDYDDSIAYDAFLGNDYILTLSREGKLLFSNLDQINTQREKLSKELFSQLVENLSSRIKDNLHYS